MQNKQKYKASFGLAASKNSRMCHGHQDMGHAGIGSLAFLE